MAGYAGPDTGWAYAAMPSGRWCYTQPAGGSNTYVVAVGQCTFQPMWIGANTRLIGVMATFPSAADTAGNVFKFAVYADRGDMWPGALRMEIPGDMPTTTTAANQAKALDCDVAVDRLTPMWLAHLSLGGSPPTAHAALGGHPYISPGAGAGLTAGLYAAGQSAFPVTAPVSLSGTQVPSRLLVRLTA